MKKLKLLTSFVGLSTLAGATAGLATSCSNGNISTIYVDVINKEKEIGSKFEESDIKVMITYANGKTEEVKYDSTGNNGYSIRGTKIGETLSGEVGEEKKFDVIYKSRVQSGSFKLKEGTGPVVSQFVVQFNTNGGSYVESKLVKKNETVEKPECTRDLYNFVCWCTDKELLHEFDFSTKITQNITLYAKWSYAETINGLVFTEINNGDEYEVSWDRSYVDITPYVKIPAANPDDGKPVTRIANQAFGYEYSNYSCPYIETIELPSTIKSIGKWAFNYCPKLKNVILNDGLVTTGEASFGHTNITEIEIPLSITSIGGACFEGCNNLKNVKLNDGLKSIGSCAFKNCTALEEITIPKTVEEIGTKEYKQDDYNSYLGYAFSGCTKLQTVTFAEGSVLKVLGNRCFESTIIKDIVLPSTLTSIGAYCFGCYSEEPGASLENIDFNGAKVTYIGESAFRNCKNLNPFPFPEEITDIQAGVFYNCKKLTSFTFSKNVKSTGHTSFSGSGLKTIDFSKCENLESIGYSCFSSCDLTGSVVLPDTVKNIENFAFAGNPNLTSINLGSGIEYIGQLILEYCEALTDAILGKTDNWYTSGGVLKEMDTPEKRVAALRDQYDILYRDTDLSGFVFKQIPSSNNVTICWDGKTLDTLTIPSTINKSGKQYSVTEIGTIDSQNGFAGASIKTINLPSTITTIPTGSFANSTTLKNIKFSLNLEKIEADTFDGTTLTAVEFENTDDIWTIGDSSEKWSPKGLSPSQIAQKIVDNSDKEWNIASTVNKIEYNIIEGTNTCAAKCVSTKGNINGIAIVPEKVEIDGVEYTVTQIADNGFAGSDRSKYKGKKVVLPKTVKYIGSSAFYNAYCDVIIPEDSELESLGQYAFKYINFQTNTPFFIPKNLNNFGYESIYYVYNLTNLKFHEDWVGTEFNRYQIGEIRLDNVTTTNVPKNITSINSSWFPYNITWLKFDDTEHSWTVNGQTWTPSATDFEANATFAKNNRSYYWTKNV